ncbi:hypothetical protein SXCC_03118 [Gluconacetobacter sp. SXCC-1]|nr:hypothetical protein SXCC_03118 [Gluconacetobacter sp. SXCC-1]
MHGKGRNPHLRSGGPTVRFQTIYVKTFPDKQVNNIFF